MSASNIWQILLRVARQQDVKCTTCLLLLGLLVSFAGCATVADDPGEPVADFPAGRFFQRGTYPAQIYSAFMRPIGKGMVTIGFLDPGYVLSVRDPQGNAHQVTFSGDLRECTFLGRVKLTSPTGFSKTKAGALGHRIERVWSSDRYMVLVGVMVDDGMHVVYLRDRTIPFSWQSFSPTGKRAFNRAHVTVRANPTLLPVTLACAMAVWHFALAGCASSPSPAGIAAKGSPAVAHRQHCHAFDGPCKGAMLDVPPLQGGQG
jgi:hypothetical protein